MASTKISGATAATAFLDADEFPVNEAGLSKKVTGTQLKTWMGKIDDQLLAGTATTITFTNPLPTLFRHLVISWYARSDTAATSTGISMRFNNISTATYDYQEVSGSAATAAAAELLAQTSIPMSNIPGATATGNYFGAGRAEIWHYQGTTGNKIVTGQTAYFTADTTGTGFAKAWTGKWRTTATAITRVDLIVAAGNFIIGSQFSCRGVY